MPRTVDKTAAGTPAPGKIGARRRGTRLAAARPQHNACTYRPSFHLPHYVDPFLDRALSALRFPVASIANIAFLSGSARVRLPADSAAQRSLWRRCRRRTGFTELCSLAPFVIGKLRNRDYR